MTYYDKHGEMFGRINESGNVVVFLDDGSAATRMDCRLYAIGSDGSQSVRYEHPEGIVISRQDADKIGLAIE